MERCGEVLVTCFALVFSDFNIHMGSRRMILLVLAFLLLALYEIFWIRYFRSDQTMKDFYRDLWGIPVAGATLPVLAFLLLAVYGQNIPMLIAVIILGFGHIGIHLQHKKEIAEGE